MGAGLPTRLACQPALNRRPSQRARRLDRDSSGADENSGHDHTEDESTDMGEERNTAANVVGGVEQRVVALEELVQEPAAEVDPRRDVDQEPQHPCANT